MFHEAVVDVALFSCETTSVKKQFETCRFLYQVGLYHVGLCHGGVNIDLFFLLATANERTEMIHHFKVEHSSNSRLSFLGCI